MRKLYQITHSLTGIKNKTILPNEDGISLCEKFAIICPIIKDHNIDKNILGNYSPVSQITLISKLTEKIVYKQIIKYIEENNLLDEFQSAYRALHSTETALINVMDDFLNFNDSNCPIQILLLDLSAAFDILDHSILEKRLLGLGIEKLALNWIKIS